MDIKLESQRRGAPRLPPGMARTMRLTTTITASDQRAVRALARSAKVPVAAWLYGVVKAELNGEDEDEPTV